MSNPTTTRTSCRVCGQMTLTPILSLGKLCVSDFTKEAQAKQQEPLEMVLCATEHRGCGLLQLRHTVSHEDMYRNYWYRSGVNKTMTNELFSIAQRVKNLVRLNPGDFVIDIGANDGTLLKSYGIEDLMTVAFEPARNLIPYTEKNAAVVFNDFFSHDIWAKKFGKIQAKGITAIAMFYDLEDPNGFVKDVAKCLDPEGVFIIQMSYLPLMLSQNAFDNICHEHLEYYSLASLEYLLVRHGLQVFDVEINDINGGSFRIYIKHKESREVQAPIGSEVRLESLRLYEANLGLDSAQAYQAFSQRVEGIKKTIKFFIQEEIFYGKKIYVYGASTKGNTLLQYFDLDRKLIGAAAERNKDKWGLYTIGTGIPIISEEQARSERPDYFLVLPWHFAAEFKERERQFLERGGKLIMPLPVPTIISVDGEKPL
ncbi:MAG: class I SAM-dependent methyltransferase [Candidatus Pacebacteria bacterium]|nr:class I SAM-dependent methyltransferase [Candidatus Paceibacterota bacterium]